MLKYNRLSRLGINLYKDKTTFMSGKNKKDNININGYHKKEISLLESSHSNRVLDLLKLKGINGFLLNIILGLEHFKFEEVNLLPKDKDEIHNILKIKKQEKASINLIEAGFNFKHNRWKYIIISLKENIYNKCFEFSKVFKRPLNFIGLRNLEIFNILYLNKEFLKKEKILNKNLMVLNISREMEVTIFREGIPFLFRTINYNHLKKDLKESIYNSINMMTDLFEAEVGESVHIYLIVNSLLGEDEITELSRIINKPVYSINNILKGKLNINESIDIVDLISIMY